MKDKLKKYIELLLKWNRVHSVTNYSKRELQEQIDLTLKSVDCLDDKRVDLAIDIGTGAGIPGIILAIALPETKWYLVEPLQKRYSLLNYIKLKLNLQNVEVIPKRLEQVEPFKVDLITSRAVKNTTFLINLSKEFIKDDTIMLLYKGDEGLKEIEEVKATKKVCKNEKLHYIVLKDFDV